MDYCKLSEIWGKNNIKNVKENFSESSDTDTKSTESDKNTN